MESHNQIEIISVIGIEKVGKSSIIQKFLANGFFELYKVIHNIANNFS